MTTSSKRLNGAFTERSEHGHFIVNHSTDFRHDQGGVQCDGEVSSKSMETRKKYKIMLSEKYVRKSENGKEWFQFPLNISGQLVAIQTIIPLDSYTEPDLEQVRKEAYEDGYKTAKVQCNIQAEKDLREVGERHYQKGLSDAWEAARKIVTWPDRSLINSDVFDLDPGESIFTKYSATKAIEKILQYEQENEEQIQVGDEVTTASGKAVVMGVGPVHFEYVYADGSHGYDEVKNVKKTGRHFPEIAEVLQKMKES